MATRPKHVAWLKTSVFYNTVKLTKYQKGLYYSGIKIFSHLPQNIKSLSWNVKKKNCQLCKGFFWWVHFIHLMNILTGFLGVILVVLYKSYIKFLFPKPFIHNLYLKSFMFITSNKLLCSSIYLMCRIANTVLQLSTVLMWDWLTDWLLSHCSILCHDGCLLQLTYTSR